MKKYEVFLNSRIVGYVEDPKRLIEILKSERRSNKLNWQISISYDENLERVNIFTSRGRCLRPLITVKDGVPTLQQKHLEALERGELKWRDLVEQGIIEWLDADEEENALVALNEGELTPEHTHVEISPISILGLITSLVPYANFSPSPRLSTGARNQKQAIGFYAGEFPIRIDTDVSLLHYPQTPIVRTSILNILNLDQHPIGHNLIVAVSSFKGYTIEDAIILNKASLERGMGRSTYYRPVIVEELRYSGGLTDEICVPTKDIKGYKSEIDYRLLEEDGIVYPEAIVKEGDVVVGKTSPPRFLSSLDEYAIAENVRRDSSAYLKHGESGIVDFVLFTESEEGNRLVQVRIRDTMIPEIGDKFISKHGQKGVVGLIVPETEMPFSASGIIPDLILSAHSIPSRMSLSHLIEMLAGKVGALAGRFIDGTPFASEKIEDLSKELLELGFKEDGTETLYDPETGRAMEVKIYIGNIYYLRLKHLVANKIQSRSRGLVQLLTRQPTEGKAKEGGLKLGEMEKDTFISHGAALLLKERFDSDKTVVPICTNCGLIAIHDYYKDIKYCPVCGEGVEVADVEMSYAFKLLLDELKSLLIYPKIKLKPKFE